MAGHNSSIEINDLINDAVKNAATRRNEALDSEKTLSSISDKEAKNITGGISKCFGPFITIGLIVPDPAELSS